MKKAVTEAREAALDIRFGQVGLARVRLRTIDPGTILNELTHRVASAPQFFDRTAVCLDLSALEHEPQPAEILAVIDAIRLAGMLPVGLAQGTVSVEALARALDLPLLAQFRAQNEPAAVAVEAVRKPGTPAVADVPEFGAAALMHHHPVRSGQRVYARHRDLVVAATVGAGAEVMADGCVHVYGPLRGRAMAGTRGEVTARVFCQEFRAELISIAGVFRVFETIPPELEGQPVQAWLDGEDLRFARIGS